MELKGKTALITGSCGEGMGRSTAFRLAREGANTVLNYGTHRQGPEIHAHAEKIAKAICELGGEPIIQEADTRDEEQVKSMVAGAFKKFGRVDILVNNAGGDWVIRDYAKIPFDHWKAVLAAEIDGAFLTMKYVLPGMRERGWGRVINIGLSNALRMPSVSGGAPDYCLGKAARAWMAMAFASQELRKGITVNCIEPGLTPHMPFEDALRLAQADSLDLQVKALRPESSKPKWEGTWRDRPGPTCHDVAELIAFLCAEAAHFLSGQVFALPHFP